MNILETGQQQFAPDALICRQSVMVQAFGSIVLAGLFAGAPVLWYWLDAPGFVVWMCVACAVLVVPLCLSELVAAMMKSNWLMGIQADGVWVNLRSFRNRKFAAAPTVLFLQWSEVEAVHTTKTEEMGSMRGSSQPYTAVYLDIHLEHFVDSASIREAIESESTRRSPPSGFAGVQSTSRSQHFPVRITDNACLRIQWRGKMTAITPGIQRTLETIQNRRDEWQVNK